MHLCLPFIKCVPVYVTPWGYKRLSVHIKDCCQKKMTGTLYPKENGCDNRVVVLTRSSCEGVPLYYVIPVRRVRQDIFSVEDFGVLKSCFSYFIHFCYSCMLQLHAKDPSLRVHGIKDVGAFVHRTLSVTYVHSNIIHI